MLLLHTAGGSRVRLVRQYAKRSVPEVRMLSMASITYAVVRARIGPQIDLFIGLVRQHVVIFGPRSAEDI